MTRTRYAKSQQQKILNPIHTTMELSPTYQTNNLTSISKRPTTGDGQALKITSTCTREIKSIQYFDVECDCMKERNLVQRNQIITIC